MFECKEGTIKPIVYVGIIKDERLLLVQYDKAPNLTKSGWWIPAPGLEFGKDPQDTATLVAQNMGLELTDLKLNEVESFVLPGGWHLIHHYIGHTSSEPNVGDNIKATRWVSSEELAQMKDLAHGKWEIGVGLRYLNL